MPCDPELLKQVPLFAGLDSEETAVLAGQVEKKTFLPPQRIYKRGDPGGRGYLMVSGRVQVTTVDEDHQEVVVDEPAGRILRLRLHAGAGAAPDRGGRHGRDRLH